jgi:hypothetical protein
MKVTIHSKHKILEEEKFNINLELPDYPDEIITRITFYLLHNSNYSKYYSFDRIDYSGSNSVIWWDVGNSDIEEHMNKLFDCFHLADKFAVYTQPASLLKSEFSYVREVVSRWDNETKVMYVDC